MSVVPLESDVVRFTCKFISKERFFTKRLINYNFYLVEGFSGYLSNVNNYRFK